jgi:hypothetical protein
VPGPLWPEGFIEGLLVMETECAKTCLHQSPYAWACGGLLMKFFEAFATVGPKCQEGASPGKRRRRGKRRQGGGVAEVRCGKSLARLSAKSP